jgi:hypothetical protein
MIETVIIEMGDGPYDGREFEVVIDPDTMEPITPVFVTEDGNNLTDRLGNVVGWRYNTLVEDLKENPKEPFNF